MRADVCVMRASVAVARRRCYWKRIVIRATSCDFLGTFEGHQMNNVINNTIFNIFHL